MKIRSLFRNISSRTLKRTLFVLGFLLMMVSIRTYLAHERLVKERAKAHYIDARRIEEHFFDRVKRNAQFLNQTKAFLVSNDSITFKSFHEFYQESKGNLLIALPYSIGCILPGSQKSEKVSAVAGDLSTEHSMDKSFVAFQERSNLEPYESFGFDYMTNRRCKELLEISRDSGSLTMGAILDLNYDKNCAPQKQVVMFLPIYQKGKPLQNSLERRNALKAWVFLRTNVQDFMTSSLEIKEELLLLKDFQLQIFNDSVSSSTLLFENHPSNDLSQVGFRDALYNFNEAKWYFKFSKLGEKNLWLDGYILSSIFIGSLLCFLVFLLLLFVYQAGDQARALAADLTIQYRRSEERLSVALQAAKESVWEWDFTTNEVYFSPFGKAMLGYTDEEVQNDFSSWEKLIHPDDFELANTYLRSFLMGDSEYYDNEYRMQHKNGHYLIILSKATKQFDPITGELLRLVGTQVDVTENRLIAQKLRESEARFRLMAENVIDVIWVLNVDQKRFTYISPSVFALRGFTAEEALSQDIDFRRDGPGSSKELLESIQSRVVLLKNDQDFDCYFTDEVLLPHKDGDLIWVEIISRYQYNNDGELEVLGVTRKIEERKKFERLIVDTNKQLQDINSIKDKFFGIIAHDLRNPFIVINGMSELLLANYKKFDQEKKIKYISSIASSSKTASQLLENLLLWARSQSDTIQFLVEDIVLEPFLNNMASDLSASLAAKDIALDIIIDNPEIVKADRYMLSFIVRNLVGNAIKFSERNQAIQIKAQKNKNSTVICVSDHGVGIHKRDQKKLFAISEKFTMPGTENEIGSGLGLLLCKEFVERNKGEIWVESEVGQGSSFYFSLPLTNA